MRILYQSCKPTQQALGQQEVSSFVITPLCTRGISGDQRYLATQAAKELDDEVRVIGLAGQGQTLLRQHGCECAFCR